MAVIHGIAGEWARVKGTIFGLWPLFLSVLAFGFSAAVAIFAHPRAGVAMSLASLVAIWLMLLKGLRRVESFYKGARGEEKVSGMLGDRRQCPPMAVASSTTVHFFVPEPKFHCMSGLKVSPSKSSET